MHLVTRVEQFVRVGRRVFSLAEGESIHTENSYKYSPGRPRRLAEAGGYAVRRLWTDERHYFSVAYLTIAGE